MKRWAFLGLVGVVGCGATGGSSSVVDDSPAGRITPELRDACPGATDDAIAFNIVIVQVAKDAGILEFEALALYIELCIEKCDDIAEDTAECPATCTLCFDAIVREIY
ncbi:MAG: hypothetical protein IH988_01835 [Planctomycetes bacterium]|nr:hypothetical protein [Planctomycetota bacterium]